MIETNRLASAGQLARDNTQLEVIAKRLDGQHQRGLDLTSRLAGTLARLRGDVPEGVATGKPQPVRSGLVGALDDTADGFAALCDRLESQLDELNRLV